MSTVTIKQENAMKKDTSTSTDAGMKYDETWSTA